MESPTAETYYKFEEDKDDEFFAREDVSALGLGDTDVTDWIHPLFSPENFLHANYEAIRPSVRLASMLISTPCLLPFWHTMFFQPKVIIPEVLQNIQGEAVWRKHRTIFDNCLTDEEVAQTQAVLACFSHMIQFRRSDQPGGGGGTVKKDVSKSFPFNFPGSASIIYYDEDTHLTLLDAEERARNNTSTDTPVVLWDRFDLAVTLVHEVAHAVQIAMYPDCDREPFFEDDFFAEVGYAWEQCIFKGSFRRIPAPEHLYCFMDKSVFAADGTEIFRKSCLGEAIALVEWPSPSLIMYYQKEGHMIGTRGNKLPWLSDLCHRVPLKWLQMLFTRSFWETYVPHYGPAALVPDLTKPFPTKAMSDGSLRHFEFDCFSPKTPTPKTPTTPRHTCHSPGTKFRVLAGSCKHTLHYTDELPWTGGMEHVDPDVLFCKPCEERIRNDKDELQFWPRPGGACCCVSSSILMSLTLTRDVLPIGWFLVEVANG